MKVHFINDPFQALWQNNTLYVQIYPALIEQQKAWGNYGAWQLLQADIQQQLIAHDVRLSHKKILELQRILKDQLAIPYAIKAYKPFSVHSILNRGS